MHDDGLTRFFAICSHPRSTAAVIPMIGALVASMAIQPVRADERIQELRDLAAIAATVCVQVTQEGSVSSEKFDAGVQAGLTGFLKKYSPFNGNINIEGKVEHYRGVLREQLASTLQDIRACQDKFMREMVPLIIPAPGPVGPPEPTEGEMQQAIKAVADNINEGQQNIAARCKHRDYQNDPGLAILCLQGAITGTMQVDVSDIRKGGCEKSVGSPGFNCDYEYVIGAASDNKSINTDLLTQRSHCRGRFVLNRGQSWILEERDCHQ